MRSYVRIPAGRDQHDDLRPVVRPVEPVPAPLFRWLGTLLTGVQYGVILASLFGPTSIYNYVAFSQPLPHIVAQWQELRWQVAGIAFFVGNLLFRSITGSRAFEIFLGDRLIFSTVGMGRHPTVADLNAGLREAGAVILLPPSSS